MSSVYDLSTSRTTRAIDQRPQKQKRLFPYLSQTPVKGNRPQLKFKKKRHSSHSHSKKNTETHVRRYDQNESFTVLSIRFATSDQGQNHEQEEASYIKAQKNKLTLQIQEEEGQDEGILPYLKYKRTQPPEQQLKNMGYNPDIRIASQVYSDKVEEKKQRYLNKMDLLKRELNTSKNDQRQERMHKCHIKVKILGEQIRRKRQREILKNQERKGKSMLDKLLRNSED